GTAHAMNEIFRRLRKVVVHDVRDAIDVDAASRNIGGDEHAIVSLLKSAERLVTLILAAIAVNGGRLNTVIGKPASQTVGAVPRPGEYQEGAFFAAQHAVQQVEFAILFDFVKAQIHLLGRFGDGADLDAHGFGDVQFHQVLDRGFDGCGEEQRLARGWN